jgi:dienelactone hydrolase
MKSFSNLISLVAILFIAGLFSAEVTAQEQQRPPRPIMRSIAPSLGRRYLQTENSLKPPSENWVNPTGPYKVVMEIDESLPNHTLYHPADLSVFPTRDKLPIIVMSGPGCDYDGDSYRPFWTEIASYGYFIIAVGRPVPEGLRAAIFFNTTEDVKDGVDWAFAVNKRKASKYYGKLDTLDVVLMGQSCGGGIMIDLVEDNRVTNLVWWNSSSRPLFGDTIQSDTDFHKTIKKPIAYFVGDTDMLRQASTENFEAVARAPVFFGVREIPGDAHGGTFREKNGGGFGVAAVAWLNWWTKGNKEAAKMFEGDPCGLERDPKWIETRKKNIK